MFVYRIANNKFKHYTLSGIGSEKFGGRWNEVGTRAVYCSENRALALLEYYIHSDNMALLPKDLLLAVIEIPDELPIKTLERLPERWKQYPYSSKTTSVFTSHVRKEDFFALKVPSTIVPMENNIILNPLYSGFSEVRIKEFVKIPLDTRLKR
ncbi:MAG: RES family NAD+ phosphorylase [bacterium]|nr:RES family NAD+ phosphorylase [bacterium]